MVHLYMYMVVLAHRYGTKRVDNVHCVVWSGGLGVGGHTGVGMGNH